ncbi:MAG: ArsA family ATPase [Solirubrobacteraceae bacterium]
MRDLLDKRVLFVMGKGGVGRSTVAAALGLAAARRGLRTVVVEVAGQHRLAGAFGPDDGEVLVERKIDERLYAITVDPDHAMAEYLSLQVRPRQMGELLASSRMFHYFAAAAPGLSELVTIGKIWELAQLERRTRGASRYDLVVVDAPATGHGVAMIRTPRQFAEIARVGPIAHQARTIDAFVSNRKKTGVVAVALPQEMPVNETLQLRDELQASGLGIDRVVANACYPQRFTARDAQALRAAAADGQGPLARSAVRAALSEQARAAEQRAQLRRLREGFGQKAAMLPFVFAPELDRPALEALSHELEEAL